MVAAPVSRRERARAATIEEIKETALALMREQGTTDVRFTDIARVMGMTPPALYRYFADRDELLTALIADAFGSLGAEVAQASNRMGPADFGGRWLAAAMAYRNWARAEPQQFALILGTPVPGYVAPEEGPTTEAAKAAMGQLAALFVAAAQAGKLRKPLIRDCSMDLADVRLGQAPRAGRHRAAGELPGHAARLGQPARVRQPRGVRPSGLDGAGCPRGALPQPGQAVGEGGGTPGPGRLTPRGLVSASMTCITALISARWVNACGKLPRCRPL